ncbi:MAG: TonB-dependent receptor [Bryobacteraceae bacterium]|nr:TonB-dependent receptor [Bryobacteraceae bacterium]
MVNARAVSAACLIASLAGALAQERTGSIAGVVKDQTGAAIQGAAIQVRNEATGREKRVTTDLQGFYRAASLDPGRYEVTAEKPGFRTSTHQDVLLELDRNAVVNHTLLVGDLSERVVVVGEARLVEATPSAISNVVDSKTIEELPLNGRDFVQLATLQSGVAPVRSAYRNVNHGYGNQMSISGSRPFQNGFWLDGVSLNTYNGGTPGSINGINLGVDAVREFTVHTSTYSAQYGRAGGGVINAATRSGGNDLHGSAFYFHRNDSLDARNFFDRGEPPEFRRHQFGGSLGGPVLRNRTFFFVNYEGFRELRGNTTINTTLSPAARRGELTTGHVAIDPKIARVLPFWPLPNGEVFGDTGLYIFANDELGHETFVTTRIDHNLGNYDKLFFRYSFDSGEREDETDFEISARRNRTRMQSFAIEESHVFSPNLMNTARLGFLRTLTVAGLTEAQVAGVDAAETAFVPGSGAMGVAIVTGLTSFPGGSGSLDYDRHVFNSFQGSDDLTLLKGSHSIKVGTRIERTHFNTLSQNRQNGEFLFPNVLSFITNRPTRFRAQLPGSDTVRGHRQWIAAWYFQDMWKISPRFTLELGLRHEWATVPTEVNGKVANLDELTSTTMRVGDPLFDNPSLKNFSPRAGLAWDLWGNGRTIVRTGYGIFPDLILSQFILLSGVRNPPFFQRGDTRRVQPGDFPSNAYNVFVDNPTPEYRIERIPRRLAQPYVQQWNFNIEQTFTFNTSLRVAYVGSHGLNLSSVTEDANLVEPVIEADGRLFFPASAPRINPLFGQLRNRTFDAHSFYHGLQTQFRQRFARGFQSIIGYTFSKSIDDSSDFFTQTQSDNYISIPLNGNPRFNRGLSGHDVRHAFVASFTWELPGPRTRLLGAVFGGWQMGGITSYASGTPFSVRLGYDGAQTKTSRFDHESGQRPDLAPGASNSAVTGDPRQWVDPSLFRRPTPGYLGNLGRNTFTGPGMTNVDFSLVKRMKVPRLGESSALDFRAEFFNLFNHTNFNLPTPDRAQVFDSLSVRGDFARITSAAKSREIQFGMKLRF